MGEGEYGGGRVWGRERERERGRERESMGEGEEDGQEEGEGERSLKKFLVENVWEHQRGLNLIWIKVTIARIKSLL